jgi:hypothetical protein
VRRLTLLCLITSTLWVSAAVAEPLVRVPAEDRIAVGDSSRAIQNGRARGGSVATPGFRVGEPVPTHQVVVLVNRGSGTCIDSVAREGAETELTLRAYEAAALRLMPDYDWCDGARPARVSPALAAQIAWERIVQLQRPQPRIQPGEAIVGKAAYLEIGGSRSGSWHVEEMGESIDLSATSVYDIDWGDGSWTRGVASNGGPWPSGDVRHVYTHDGRYTITVHQRWSATYSTASGASGSVPGTLQTRGSIPDFPVIEVQAVRNR